MEDSVIDKIKERLDIVDVIGSYVKLQKTGINYRARCPFHSEKKPSFFVSPTRQSWRCFGCGKGGSVFDFVMEIEGIEFGDALRILAQKAGVELKTFRPELKTARTRLYEICELSCCFFEKQLEKSSVGKEVEKYFLKRGLTEDSVKKWRLGYSPDTWRGLSDFLVGKGYKREEIVRAGLAVESEKSGTPYDRFRGRVIFPVFDLNSQVIGFGGRIFEKPGSKEEIAKYINIPNTPLYDKSRILYGLNFAKVEIRRKDFTILTEGYMDVILAHQAGFENTIASSGTSLTPGQLKILKRYTPNLYTAFDMDVAGDLATKKGIDLAQREDFEIKVISLPKDSDPADIISQNPDQWGELVAGAQDIVSFYFQSAFSKFNKEKPEGKREISKILLPKIKEIPSIILQAHWIQKLSNKIRVGEEAVWEELKKVAKIEKRIFPEPEPESSTVPKEKTRKQLLEERILSLVLRNPKDLETVGESSIPLFSPEMKLIFSSLCKEKERDKKKIEKILAKLEKEGESIKEILDTASLLTEIEESDLTGEKKEENLKYEIELCLYELKKFDLKNKLEYISKQIKIAEQNKEKKKIKDLVEKFNQMAKQLTLK